MTAAEHSILVCLLQLCKREPEKRYHLAALAKMRDRSDEFCEYIGRLITVIKDRDAFIQLCYMIIEEIK